MDNTLWDLRGRYYNAPVYRLLGGPTRASVEAYVSCLGFSVEPEPARAKAIEFKNQGFRCQKWFMAYGPGDGPAGLAKNVELVRVLREAVGEEVDLMFDAFSGWDFNYALAWAKQVERYRPRWIEEAFQADKIESFAQLRRATSIPVASGEHIYNRWEVQDYLKAGALNVVQADPEWCGGISELVKICTVASLYDVQVIPHGHSLHEVVDDVRSFAFSGHLIEVSDILDTRSPEQAMSEIMSKVGFGSSDYGGSFVDFDCHVAPCDGRMLSPSQGRPAPPRRPRPGGS